MTDTATNDSVESDVLQALSAHRWMTARECWQRIICWSHISVRHKLRELDEAGQIEGRVAGTSDRPVREYRAWR